MTARWIQALAGRRAPSLDVPSSFVRVCVLLRKMRHRRLSEDGIRFSLSSPRFGGAFSIVSVRVENPQFNLTHPNSIPLEFGVGTRHQHCQLERLGAASASSGEQTKSFPSDIHAPSCLIHLSFLVECVELHFVSSRKADVCGVPLKATNSVNSRFFSTAYGKKLRFLISNKSSFINPNINREDGGAAHRYFHRSERRQSTLAACSTIADEASTSTSKCSESGTGTKKDIAKNKNSGGSKKEVSIDVKEKKVFTKKKSSSTKTSKTAANTTEKASVKQEEKKADTSKSKKGVGSSKERKTVTSSKKSLEAKESAAIAAAEANNYMKTTVDASGSERRPLVPLYPPVAKSVIVVESVTKAKVIQQYLGDMYEVLPSYGHVRDLARRSRSVRPEDDFSMVWEVPNGAWTCLKSIGVALKGAENLILASDPDREVNAYLARRSLDYLIGFAISPLLWRKLPGCQSAGRVQSAALALVCDRETEIEKFSPQEYWTVDTEFETQCSDSSKGICLTSWIKHLNSKKLDQLSISSQEEARALEKRIYSCQFEVAQKLYEGMNLSSEQATGLITYLRTDGFHISHGAAEDIRSLVKQRIYGIGYCETQYLISLNIYNPSIVLYGEQYASEDIRKYLKKRIGTRRFGSTMALGDGGPLLGEEYIQKRLSKIDNQGSMTIMVSLSASLIGILDEDSLKLYTLIWRRTMACQMEASRTELIQVGIGNPEGDMIFHSSASRLDFKGYQAVYEVRKYYKTRLQTPITIGCWQGNLLRD
ncbi:DNA topoisomerase 1 [Triticum urartu]|uniref:DNA topoisomerase 1 n=1 Tax=Triticum urartu TaxID=4572 RepID=M7YNE1_TRIUA|nr:DNA topoisomerase 1 [Triticum urartu]